MTAPQNFQYPSNKLLTCTDCVAQVIMSYQKMSVGTYIFHSAVWGYHVYKDPVIGKQLSCREDRHNVHDVYAVAVVESDTSYCGGMS